MNAPANTAAIILAGGRGRRFNHWDKGLIEIAQKPMIESIVEAVASLANTIVISANRNVSRYQYYTPHVVSDTDNDFNGPLSGILSCLAYLRHADNRTRFTEFEKVKQILLLPCDMPGITCTHLRQVINYYQENETDCDLITLHDGKRLQPLVCTFKLSVADKLEYFFKNGGRSVQDWFAQLKTKTFYAEDWHDALLNINSEADLRQFEKR